MYTDVTGIILAGGKSTRMGTNKALLKIGEEYIIQRATRLLAEVCPRIIVITNTPEEYNFLQVPLFKDEFTGFGPLAGLHSGLLHSATGRNFILSCDIPFLTKTAIECIINYRTNKSVTLCKAEGFLQSMAGVYNTNLLESVSDELNGLLAGTVEKKGCTLHSFLKKIDIEIIDAEIQSWYSTDLFFNMNKSTDYDRVLQQLSENRAQ